MTLMIICALSFPKYSLLHQIPVLKEAVQSCVGSCDMKTLPKIHEKVAT